VRPNRGNRAGPWFSKKRFTDDDPRLQYTIERPDYRVLFALSIHSYSSPCLRLYDADNIEVWLNLATEEYISSNVQILPAKDRQVIPPPFPPALLYPCVCRVVSCRVCHVCRVRQQSLRC
jgi:hypothetical protein